MNRMVVYRSSRRRHSIARAAVACVLAALLAGCAGLGRDFQQVEGELARGNVDGALERLEPMAGSRLSEALYQMNRGMLLRHKGDLAGSVEAFARAKDIIGLLEPISLSESLATWTVTETAGSYVPPAHEHLLLHAFQLLNYLELGDVDSARVEALQIDLGLRRLDPANGAAPDGGDAFARHVSGLAFEANGDWSDAMIAYRRAYQAYRRQDAPIPRDLQYSLVRLADHLELHDERDGYAEAFGIESWEPMRHNRERAMLLVVVQDGLGPTLEERTMVVQAAMDQFVRVSLPALRPRPTLLRGTRVVANGAHVDADASESVSRAADQWLDRQMPGLIARSAARNVARYGATERIGQENALLGLAVNVAGLLLEQSDTRIWRTLPDRVYLARLDLPPGEQALRLEFVGSGGRMLATEERAVYLRAGEPTVLSSFWLDGSRY